MKLPHTKVKFYPELKSQTGLSSLRVSCKRALICQIKLLSIDQMKAVNLANKNFVNQSNKKIVNLNLLILQNENGRFFR